MIDRRNGTIRTKRVEKDLMHSPFRIDAQESWDLMGYIASYLEKINYFNVQNKKEGNWKKLVENDPSFFMSLIINESTNDLDQLIQKIDRRDIEEIGANKEMLIAVIAGWCSRIELWQKTLSDLKEKKLAFRIKNSLDNVSSFSCDDLRSIYTNLKQTKGIAVKNELESKQAHTLRYAPPPRKKLNPEQLGNVAHDFRKAIEHIKEITKKHLERNLLDNKNHLANNALYIAFTQLYAKLQSKLNDLSKRHLDFYYTDVLQQKNAAGVQTRTIVCFDLLPTVKYTHIPKGTRLSAGKVLGSKTDVFFETNKPLLAYEASIVDLQTLLFNTNPDIEIGVNTPLISSASRSQLIEFGKDVTPRDDWYVFGANKESIHDNKLNSSKAAKIGFIIGSPVLFLKEGSRSITFRINLDPTSAKDNLWKYLDEIKKNKKILLSSAFSQVFKNSFKISYTGEKEWVNCIEYALDFNETESFFSIELLLDNSYPALVKASYHDRLSWPSVKVELNDYAPVYVYSFFKDVRVLNISIDVAVKGIKDVSLYNNIGKMPLGKPFEIFGPTPKKDDYLMVGYSEIFRKEIDTLSVSLDWDSVPSDFGGFETYYEGYDEQITNESFKVQFSALSNNFWLPVHQENTPTKNLFETTACLTPEGYKSVQLNSSSHLKFDKINELDISADKDLKDPLLYTVTTPGGFIKISFVAPEMGFGIDQYKNEYREIATYNARHKSQLSYPNKPFIPKLKGIELQYQASDQLLFTERIPTPENSQKGKGEFLHVTPYMIDEVIVDQEVKKDTLLPNFDCQGYLILGLKGVQSKSTISIFFNFLRSSSAIEIERDAITWEYFNMPNWDEFDSSDIILDNTDGFMKTGTVEILLPSVDGKARGYDHEILWIRACAKKDVYKYPKIKGVYLNAVEATCTVDDESIIGENIQESKITKVIADLPDVKSVIQPAKSFGGRLKETYEQLNSRVSEQLRHKGRGVSLWDYERLILEKFEEVKIVKCSSFNSKFEPEPGTVRVIVLSSRWTIDERYYFNKGTLDRMKKYLNRISSSFIDIKVMNPSIEYLLVNCAVQFKPEDTGGYFLQQLNDDISDYLSPISNMDQNIGGIGGRVVPLMVACFVESLSYIERLDNLSIEHIIREGTSTFSMGVHKGGEEISSYSPWSILSPLKEHRIVTLARDNEKRDLSKIGIGDMEVGVDLILGKEHPPHSEKMARTSKKKNKSEAQPINAFLEFKHKV